MRSNFPLLERIARTLEPLPTPTPSRAMATKERLHRLIEELPDGDVPAATEALERLRMARVRRALANAPEDDEPLTEAERQAIEEAEEDLRRGERPIPMDEVKRPLGIA